MQEIAEFWSQSVRQALWGFEPGAGDRAQVTLARSLSWADLSRGAGVGPRVRGSDYEFGWGFLVIVVGVWPSSAVAALWQTPQCHDVR